MRFQIFMLLALSLLAGGVPPAQGGGKAEPNRLEFARGTSSTTIKESIRRTEEAEYVFGAHQGQRITITLTSAATKTALFRLRNGENVYSDWGFDGTHWTGTAPVTGDYLITVVAAAGAPRRINYALKLAIK